MNVRIAATGQVKFGEHWELGIEELARLALANLFKEAEYGWEDIEVIFLANCFSERFLGIKSLSSYLINRLGWDLPVIAVGGGDASGAVAVRRAAQMLEGKQYKRALVLGVEKVSDQLSDDVQSALTSLLDAEEIFYGQTLAGSYALIAREYMKQYGVTADDLAEISFKNHQNSTFNPIAQFNFNLALEKIQDSPITADPLRILDGASFCDGAAALILEKADKRKKGIHLVASGYGRDQLALADRRSVVEMAATRQAAGEAYEMAALTVDEVNFAEVHDVYTVTELMAIEDLGLAPAGHAVELSRAGETRIKGSRPINPSGGLKACGHALGATGVRQTIEVYNQLRGEAGKRQVKQAEVGLTHNLCGNGSECVVNIFNIS